MKDIKDFGEITLENCRQIVIDLKQSDFSDSISKSAAWSVVYEFCMQNGMGRSPMAGIEMVIEFISKLLPKEQEVQGN